MTETPKTNPETPAPETPSPAPSLRWLWWMLGGGTVLGLASAFGIVWVMAANRVDAKVHEIEVVAEYPHDARAFTQGLVYHDGVLYESTGQYGESTLRRVELETGKPQKVTPLGRNYFAEGLALWNDRLIQLTWRERSAFVYDRATFRRRRTQRYTGEGWGLTFDGTHLVMSDGTSTLRFLDPRTFEVVRRLQVTDGERAVDRLNELEFVRGEILANIWYGDTPMRVTREDYIARIDPKTGNVVGWIDCSGLYPRRRDRNDVLNGIAWDAEKGRLFVTGKNWPKLYEITVKP